MTIKTWDKKELKDLCSRIGDGLHGTPKYVDDSDIYFINGNNLKNGSIEITADTKKVTEAELSKNFIQLDKNSLLLSINGTLGSMAFYNGEKVMLGKSAAYLNFNSEINKFYYYYFQLKDIQKYFWNVATGSTIKNLSLKSIQDFIVPVPKEDEWRKITNILSDLDAKIELNNNINAELEGMAKLLYDYWFVQFDFPDANGKPYKSSGGKMVYNEQLKREIPEGWEVKSISDIVPVVTGKKDANHSSDNGKYPFFTCADNPLKCDDFEFSGKSVLVAGNGNFNVKIYEGEFNAYQRTYVLQPNTEEYWSLVYFLVKDRIQILTKGSRGSIIKFMTKGDLEDIIFPNSIDHLYLLQKLNTVIEKVLLNKKENQKLSELRDWLLPMLMNGQVTVGEAVQD